MSTKLPLNQWRDDYVSRLRALIERFRGSHPGDLKGILGRGTDLVDGQLPALDRLAGLDLEVVTATPDAARDAVAVLYRSQHLPTMLIAMSRVLEQQEKDKALRPVAVEAQSLAAELAALTQAWVMLHQEELGPDEDEDDLWV